ncbi:MAG: PDDEXK nuclease domain-containing protein [Solirubrobacteraceae bacterium]
MAATKDPCVFDFLELAEDAQERDLEQALIVDIQKFLLELVTGFAFYGRQKALLVGDQEFFLDLPFYRHALRRFVVIELKVGKFQPEFVSKMNLITEGVPADLGELSELGSVRTRLIERVTRRAPETATD